MKRRWYMKEQKEIVSLLAASLKKIELLKEEQEDKLNNYPENFIGTSNYEVSEERLEKIEEIEEECRNLIDLLEDL